MTEEAARDADLRAAAAGDGELAGQVRRLSRQLGFLARAGALAGVGAIITARAARLAGHLDDGYTGSLLREVGIQLDRADDDPEALPAAGALLAAEIDRLRSPAGEVPGGG